MLGGPARFPGKRWRKTMPPEMNRPRDPVGSPPRTTLLSEHHPRPGRLPVRGGCSRIRRMFPCRRNFSYPAGTTPTSKSHRFVRSRPVAKPNRSPRPADHPMAIIDPADPMRTVSHTNRLPHANRCAAGPRVVQPAREGHTSPAVSALHDKGPQDAVPGPRLAVHSLPCPPARRSSSTAMLPGPPGQQHGNFPCAAGRIPMRVRAGPDTRRECLCPSAPCQGRNARFTVRLQNCRSPDSREAVLLSDDRQTGSIAPPFPVLSIPSMWSGGCLLRWPAHETLPDPA